MRSYFRLTALCCALAASMPLAANAQADALADAQKLLKQGQFQQALEKTDAYVASKPKDAQGRFLRGLILTEMNRPADAIPVFTKLTEDFPELPEPYNNLAVLYAQQKQYDKARAALEMAIRTHPSYAIAHENLGDVYSKLASQAYDKALQLDSSNSAAQTKLSLIRDLITVSAKPGSVKPLPGKATEPAKVAAAESKPAAAAVAAAPAAKPAVAATPATPAVPAKVEKTAEKAPEKAAEKPAPKADNDADVKQALQAWAAAWGRKDVKAYLAHYAADFQTPGGQNRKAWEAERESRIDKPGSISVELDNIRITFDGADKATAKFRQHYRSASLKSSANKTLTLVRAGGKWLIQQERVGG